MLWRDAEAVEQALSGLSGSSIAARRSWSRSERAAVARQAGVQRGVQARRDLAAFIVGGPKVPPRGLDVNAV